MKKLILYSMFAFSSAASFAQADFQPAAFYGTGGSSPRECLTAEQPIFWCVSDTEIRGCTRRSPQGGNNAECFGGRSAHFAICNSSSGTRDFTGCRLF